MTFRNWLIFIKRQNNYKYRRINGQWWRHDWTMTIKLKEDLGVHISHPHERQIATLETIGRTRSLQKIKASRQICASANRATLSCVSFPVQSIMAIQNEVFEKIGMLFLKMIRLWENWSQLHRMLKRSQQQDHSKAQPHKRWLCSCPESLSPICKLQLHL